MFDDIVKEKEWHEKEYDRIVGRINEIPERKNGEILVCPNCKEYGLTIHAVFSTPLGNNVELITYECLNCRYKFKRRVRSV